MGLAALGLMALAAGCSSGDTPVDGTNPRAVPLSAEEARSCRSLVAALPGTLSGLESRTVTADDPLTAAWGDPAVVLTCGVEVPTEFDEVASCLTVNGVDWFAPDDELSEPTGEELVLTTVYRDVSVELRFPVEHWPPAAALSELSAPVKAHTTATDHCV